jgi:hypothetical protein
LLAKGSSLSCHSRSAGCNEARICPWRNHSSIQRQQTLAELSTVETLATGDANDVIQLALSHTGSGLSVRCLLGKVEMRFFDHVSRMRSPSGRLSFLIKG